MTLEALPVDDDGTEGWDTCPVCDGDWLKCGCDPKDADAAYQPDDAA